MQKDMDEKQKPRLLTPEELENYKTAAEILAEKKASRPDFKESAREKRVRESQGNIQAAEYYKLKEEIKELKKIIENFSGIIRLKNHTNNVLTNENSSLKAEIMNKSSEFQNLKIEIEELKKLIKHYYAIIKESGDLREKLYKDTILIKYQSSREKELFENRVNILLETNEALHERTLELESEIYHKDKECAESKVRYNALETKISHKIRENTFLEGKLLKYKEENDILRYKLWASDINLFPKDEIDNYLERSQCPLLKLFSSDLLKQYCLVALNTNSKLWTSFIYDCKQIYNSQTAKHLINTLITIHQNSSLDIESGDHIKFLFVIEKIYYFLNEFKLNEGASNYTITNLAFSHLNTQIRTAESVYKYLLPIFNEDFLTKVVKYRMNLGGNVKINSSKPDTNPPEHIDEFRD